MNFEKIIIIPNTLKMDYDHWSSDTSKMTNDQWCAYVKSQCYMGAQPIYPKFNMADIWVAFTRRMSVYFKDIDKIKWLPKDVAEIDGVKSFTFFCEHEDRWTCGASQKGTRGASPKESFWLRVEQGKDYFSFKNGIRIELSDAEGINNKLHKKLHNCVQHILEEGRESSNG
jgi:hypothetical protein